MDSGSKLQKIIESYGAVVQALFHFSNLEIVLCSVEVRWDRTSEFVV